MNRIQYENNWPESWKLSYYYDCQELWGEIDNYTYYYCYKNRRDAALKYLTSAIPNNGRIIDIAAGQGNFSLSLAEMGYNVTWNDLRTELSEYVRKKYERKFR
jgi:2-polyprenyl-6-hydroxyphenyl methylase/3-demethylubiquinone-9 3-methyltransferase